MFTTISLHTVVAIVLWSFALFVFFLAYTTVLRAEENGAIKDANWLFWVAAKMVKVLGGVIDITFNIFLGTLLFLELPKLSTITFTHRCAAWMTQPGVRGDIARGICKQLGVFDKEHCKPKSN